MFKRVMLLVFLLSTNIFAMQDQEAALGENIKPLRIGFFIGSSKESFCDGGGAAITYDFACAISQRALDVAIVSDYVLKNLILRKYTKVIDPVLEKDRNDFDHILEKIDFDLSDRDFYHVQDTQFFVLIPRDYDNPILNKAKWTKINLPANPEYNGSGNDSFPFIPWVKGTPSEAKQLLSDINLKLIPYAKNLGSKIIDSKLVVVPQHKFEPKQIAWFFNAVEDYENLSQSQPCNIYISGHGAYSYFLKKETSSIASMSPDDMANILFFFNDKINTKSIRISTCEAGGKNLDLIQIKNDLVDKTKQIFVRIKYILIIDSLTDAPTTSDWKAEDSASTNLKGYFDALENFQNGHKDFVDKLNAIRAKKATADVEAMKKIKSEIKTLEQESGLTGILNKMSLPKDWYLRPLGLNACPQVWIPEVGWYQTFIPAKINDAKIIRNITNPIFKDEEVETKEGKTKKVNVLDHLEFDLHKPMELVGWSLLLLYSEIVFTNLNIRPQVMSAPSNKLPKWLKKLYTYFPSIPCLDSICIDVAAMKDFCIYPQIVSMQHGNSLSLFAKISLLPNPKKPLVDTGILNFLRDSFLILRDRKSSQVFFIKELEGCNDFTKILDKKDKFRQELEDEKTAPQQIKLQNVFIATSFSNSSTYINISFEFNGKAWVFINGKKELHLTSKNPKAEKPQNIWIFKLSNEVGHEANLKHHGLTYLAKLTPAAYYTQLPAIRRLFKNQKTKSLQEFIIDLKPEEIIDAMEESPIITKAEWIQFEQPKNQLAIKEKLRAQTQLELRIEQQFRLQMNLKRLKDSLRVLKQKIELLRSKLEQLKGRLSSMI